MLCPYCKTENTRVVDSRISDDGYSINRRRMCDKCSKRFSTQETASIVVVKRNGTKEQFDKEKIKLGILKACQGIEVDENELDILTNEVELSIRSKGSAEIDTYDIGLAILEPLKKISDVGYLRFASIYNGFTKLSDYTKLIESLS